MRKALLAMATLFAAASMQATTAYFAAPDGYLGQWSFGAPGDTEVTPMTPVSDQQPYLFKLETSLTDVAFTNGSVTITVNGLENDMVYSGLATGESYKFDGPLTEVSVRFCPATETMVNEGRTWNTGADYYIVPRLNMYNKSNYTNYFGMMGGLQGIKMTPNPDYAEGYVYDASFLVPECYEDNNNVEILFNAVSEGVVVGTTGSGALNQYVGDGKIVNYFMSVVNYPIPMAPVPEVFHGRIDVYTVQDGHNIMMTQGDAALTITTNGVSSWDVCIENLTLPLAEGEEPTNLGNLELKGLGGYVYGDRQYFSGGQQLDDFMGGAYVYASGWHQGNDVSCEFTISLGEEYGNRTIGVFFYCGDVSGKDFSTLVTYPGKLSAWTVDENGEKKADMYTDRPSEFTVFTTDGTETTTDLTLSNLAIVVDGQETNWASVLFKNVEGLMTEDGVQYSAESSVFSFVYYSIPVKINGTVKEDGSVDMDLTMYVGTEMTVKGKFTTGDGDVAVDNIAAEQNGDAIYYNLQGQRVSQPQNGVFVRVQNGKAVKVAK